MDLMNEYFLGVDGGGSKTAVVIIDSEGNVISKAVGGGSNYRALGTDVAGKNLKEVIFKAVGRFKGKIKYSCFGMASVDTKKDKRNVKKFIEECGIKRFLSCPILILNDVEIILPAITEKNKGVAVIGGTGSNFYAINGRKKAKAAGLDYILADEGSAYDIGLKVLRSAVRSYDGRGNKTLLEKYVFKMARVKNVQELKDVVHEGLKSQIASFSKLATLAASKGDRVAKEILDYSAGEFILGIKAVVKKVGLKGDFDIAFTGSLFTKKVIYDKVVKEIRKSFPKARFHIVKESALGAAKLAMRHSFHK